MPHTIDTSRIIHTNQADEEYEIEKSNIVRSETSSIDKLYEDKLKKAELAQQITKSTIANKTRLKVLSERETVLDDIYSATAAELAKVVKDQGSYKKILSLLIEEGLYTLLEPKVTVKVKKEDAELVTELVPDLAQEFEKNAKFPVEITILDDYLDEKAIGGVVLANGSGKVSVNNTLAERLHLLGETALPLIRLELFGPSKTRRFFD